MPNIAAERIFICPAPHGDAAGNPGSCKILVAAHHFQDAVCVIGHGVKANQLMGHGNGKQVLHNLLPVVQVLVVEIGPVKVEVLVEDSVGAGVGEIHRFIRLHGNENLNQRKQAGEHTLVRVFFDLVAGLAHIHAAALQFTVNHRHTVDQQHKIAPAIGKHIAAGLEHWLLGNLIAALAGGDFPLVIDFQADFLAIVEGVGRVIPLDGDGFAVDKAVQLQRGAQTGDLVQNLVHLAVRQRDLVQTVDLPVVLKEDLFPVLDQVLLGFIAQNFRLPAVFFGQ